MHWTAYYVLCFGYVIITVITRSTGTVHTSTKARLTSVAIWRVIMSNRFMSINNHFPYLRIVINLEKIPVSRRWLGSPPKFNHLFIGPLLTFPDNFMQSHLEVFHKVANKQTNNDDYISSLAEVMRFCPDDGTTICRHRRQFSKLFLSW